MTFLGEVCLRALSRLGWYRCFGSFFSGKVRGLVAGLFCFGGVFADLRPRGDLHFGAVVTEVSRRWRRLGLGLGSATSRVEYNVGQLCPR